MFNCIFATTTPPTSFLTPSGTPTSLATGIAQLPTYSGSLDQIILEHFKKSEDSVSFQESKQRVPGRNHKKTGILTVKGQPFFVIQRRYQDYGERPPVSSVDLTLNSEFANKTLQIQAVLGQTKMVPLLERIVQQKRTKKYYVEIYPLIDGCDGDVCIKTLIGQPDRVENLESILQLMGQVTAQMLASREPHADCQPSNFFVRGNEVYAIDFRGNLRALDRRTQTPPALLFLEMLSDIIRQKLNESIIKSTDFKQLASLYKALFEKCREAYMMGMFEILDKQKHLYDGEITLNLEEIMSKSARFENANFPCESDLELDFKSDSKSSDGSDHDNAAATCFSPVCHHKKQQQQQNNFSDDDAF